MNKLYSIFNKNHTSSKINYSRDNKLNIKNNSKSNYSTYGGCKDADWTYQNLSVNVISSSNKVVFFDIIEDIENQDLRKNI